MRGGIFQIDDQVTEHVIPTRERAEHADRPRQARRLAGDSERLRCWRCCQICEQQIVGYERHEAGRRDPWSIDDAPVGYVETMVRAIVGLELRITRLEAKRKLSQNRSAADVEGVIAGLTDGSPRERAVAAEMRAESGD